MALLALAVTSRERTPLVPRVPGMAEAGLPGYETQGSKSPEEFAAFIAEDAKLWGRVVRDSGAKAG